MFAWIALLAFFSIQTGLLGAQPPEKAAEKTAQDASADEENTDEENAEDENGEDEEPASLGALVFKRPETTSEWVGLAFYILLCIFSMVALTVTLERILHLRHERVIPKTFVGQLQEQTGKGPVTADQLRTIANGSDTPVARILHAGVLRAGRSLAEVEKSMEDAAIREMAAMRARNRALSVVGSVAPLVGLLGTVVGMIFAFQVSSQEGLGKAELLAKGIYIALLTTAGGLTIAIPCLLVVAWFNALIERFMREIDECLLETVPSFTKLESLQTHTGRSD